MEGEQKTTRNGKYASSLKWASAEGGLDGSLLEMEEHIHVEPKPVQLGKKTTSFVVQMFGFC